MKKETKRLLLNAFIMMGISGILLLGYVYFVPKDIDDEVFHQVIHLDNEIYIADLPEELPFEVIYKQFDAVTPFGKTIGTIYEVIAYNCFPLDEADGHGTIHMYVGIQDETVYVQSIEVKQTASYVAGIKHFIESYFDGVYYENIEQVELFNAGDLEAGATATISTSIVKRMVQMVVDRHFELEKPSSELMYGNYFEEFGYALIDEDFESNGIVVEKTNLYDINDQLLGHSYTMYLVGIYNEEYDATSIQFHTIVDLNQTIVGSYVLEDEYHHSGGPHLARIIAYIESFDGVEVEAITPYYPEDWSAGATSDNTRLLVNDMFEALKEVLS